MSTSRNIVVPSSGQISQHHLILVNRAWTITHADEAAAVRAGLSAAELVGRDFWECFPELRGAPVEAMIRRAMRDRVPQHMEHRTGEGAWLEVCLSPLPEGLAIHVREVTQRKADDEALRDSEQLLRAATEAGGIGTFEWDLRTGRIRYSPTHLAIFGLPPDASMSNSEWLERIVPEDRARVQATLRQALADGESYRHEYRIARPDGQVRWLESVGRINREQGAAVSVLGALRDVTERQATEAALRESRALYQTLTETMPDLVWACDAQRRAVYVSSRWRQYTGLSLEEVNRCGWLSLIHPDDRPAVEQRWDEASRAGEPFEAEFRYRRHDGVDRWFWARAVPMRDEAGRLARWVGISTDISDRRSIERALRQSEARFRATFEQAAVGMAQVALNGRFLLINRRLAQITGYSREELVRKTFQEVTYPEDLGPDLAQAQRLLSGEIPDYALEKRYVRQDGSLVWVHLSGSLVRSSAGEPLYFIAAVEDISARKRVEEELRRLNESLERRVAERTAVAEQRAAQLRALASEITLAEQRERRQLAMMLHDELAQLLAVARLRLGAIRDLPPDSNTAAAVGEAMNCVTEAIGFTRALMHDLAPAVLYELGLTPAVNELAERMARHSLRVAVEADGQAIPLDEELRDLLFKSVRELLFNVVKHAGAGEARVLITQRPQCLVLSVEDQGHGFDPAALRGRPGEAGGFGLLHLRERLELLGGSMEIDSAPGRGTRITLTAPTAAKGAD